MRPSPDAAHVPHWSQAYCSKLIQFPLWRLEQEAAVLRLSLRLFSDVPTAVYVVHGWVERQVAYGGGSL